MSDKQIEIGIVGATHVGGHTSDSYIIEQFLAQHSHHIHRHLASDKFHTVSYSGVAQLFELVDVFALHYVAHHFSANA